MNINKKSWLTGEYEVNDEVLKLIDPDFLVDMLSCAKNATEYLGSRKFFVFGDTMADTVYRQYYVWDDGLRTKDVLIWEEK